MKILTLVLIVKDDHVLLGFKKRGFGACRWNGFGGKVHKGESIEDAARRELFEEAGIASTHLEKRGILSFSFENGAESLEVHVFLAEAFRGVPQETEEMKPQWFSVAHIPFDRMWPDDRYWFPLFLEGRKFAGDFHLAELTGDSMLLRHSLKEVDSLNK